MEFVQMLEKIREVGLYILIAVLFGQIVFLSLRIIFYKSDFIIKMFEGNFVFSAVIFVIAIIIEIAYWFLNENKKSEA